MLLCIPVVHTYVETRGQPWASFTPLRPGLPLAFHSFIQLGWMGSCRVPRILLSPPPQHWDCKCVYSLCRFWRTNSGSQAWGACTLLTEPSPNLAYQIFITILCYYLYLCVGACICLVFVFFSSHSKFSKHCPFLIRPVCNWLGTGGGFTCHD